MKPGIRLVYLDNAATSQKPRQVLEELNRFYGSDNSSLGSFGVFSVSFFKQIELDILWNVGYDDFDILWHFFFKGFLMEVGIAVRNVRLWRIVWFNPCRSVLPYRLCSLDPRKTSAPSPLFNRNWSAARWELGIKHGLPALHLGLSSSLSGNVHRGMHTLSMRSTEAFEGARKKVADFVNAPDVHEPWLRVGPRWSLDVKTLTGLLTGNSIKNLDWIGYIRYVIVPVMYKCIYIYRIYI